MISPYLKCKGSFCSTGRILSSCRSGTEPGRPPQGTSSSNPAHPPFSWWTLSPCPNAHHACIFHAFSDTGRYRLGTEVTPVCPSRCSRPECARRRGGGSRRPHEVRARRLAAESCPPTHVRRLSTARRLSARSMGEKRWRRGGFRVGVCARVMGREIGVRTATERRACVWIGP